MDPRFIIWLYTLLRRLDIPSVWLRVRWLQSWEDFRMLQSSPRFYLPDTPKAMLLGVPTGSGCSLNL